MATVTTIARRDDSDGAEFVNGSRAVELIREAYHPSAPVLASFLDGADVRTGFAWYSVAIEVRVAGASLLALQKWRTMPLENERARKAVFTLEENPVAIGTGVAHVARLSVRNTNELLALFERAVEHCADPGEKFILNRNANRIRKQRDKQLDAWSRLIERR